MRANPHQTVTPEVDARVDHTAVPSPPITAPTRSHAGRHVRLADLRARHRAAVTGRQRRRSRWSSARFTATGPRGPASTWPAARTRSTLADRFALSSTHRETIGVHVLREPDIGADDLTRADSAPRCSGSGSGRPREAGRQASTFTVTASAPERFDEPWRQTDRPRRLHESSAKAQGGGPPGRSAAGDRGENRRHVGSPAAGMVRMPRMEAPLTLL